MRCLLNPYSKLKNNYRKKGFSFLTKTFLISISLIYLFDN